MSYETASPQQTPPIEPPNVLFAYVGAFVDELQRAGVHHAVVCPGSRSTPLAMTLAGAPGIRVWMHVDERSAAFFALGLAKRLAEPVVLVCTSGTAGANFWPAVVEAHLSHVPLLVLTADRPPELRDNGAPQAIDQQRLYGVYAKWFVEMALPEGTDGAMRYARTMADRAVAETLAEPAGPVQCNFPLREPLTPDPSSLPAQRDAGAWYGRPDGAAYVAIPRDSTIEMAQTEMMKLVDRLRQSRAGLICVGAHTEERLPQAILQLAHCLDYLVLADPLANLRSLDDAFVLPSYDALLRDARFTASTRPEMILRFGAMPTSKTLLKYLERYPECPQIVVASPGEWPEPTQLAAMMIHTAPVSLCTRLTKLLRESDAPAKAAVPSNPWLERWRAAEQATRSALVATIERFDETFEGRVFTELAQLLPGGAMLFAGNSMPIRDCDTFFAPEQWVRVMGNRGGNGIDGVVSTALGVSAAGREPIVLVIGDLSFYHDLNGLLAAKLHQLDLTVVLVNNDGGGIFSFLAPAAYPAHFEQLFGTPTGLDFALAVQMYGGVFTRPQHWEEFRAAVSAGIRQGGLHVIEVRSERERNVTQHRELWQAVAQSLASRGITPTEEP